LFIVEFVYYGKSVYAIIDELIEENQRKYLL